jgi:hypothetical protein
MVMDIFEVELCRRGRWEQQDARFVAARDVDEAAYKVAGEPFHGVRAIRLVPVGDGKMFGRDGLLAHSYMLGPNGQSNGCVSFSDYPCLPRCLPQRRGRPPSWSSSTWRPRRVHAPLLHRGGGTTLGPTPLVALTGAPFPTYISASQITATAILPSLGCGGDDA